VTDLKLHSYSRGEENGVEEGGGDDEFVEHRAELVLRSLEGTDPTLYRQLSEIM
jgi:hypothetical protein